MLEALGASVVLVRQPADLDSVAGVVLPGGESTTLSMLLDSAGLREPLAQRLEEGMPTLGTCAGMILLAGRVLDGRIDQQPLAVIDITVRRNAFGRQLDSFETDLDVVGLDRPLHAVFIRAPIIESTGPKVEVLATLQVDGASRVVCAREGVVTVTSFHPELAGDDRLHRRFLEDVASLAASQA